MTLLDRGLDVDAWLRRRPAQKRGPSGLPLAIFAIDVVVLACASLIALALRSRIGLFEPAPSVDEQVAVAAPAMVVGWVLLLLVFGAYRASLFGSGTDEFRVVLNASLVTVGGVGITCYLSDFQLARGYFLLVVVLGIPGLMVGRLAARRTLQRARTRGVAIKRTLIAGSPAHIDELARVLSRETWLGYSVVGAVTPNGQPPETSIGVPVLGTVADLRNVIRDQDAEVLMVAAGAFESARDLRTAAWGLEEDEQDLEIIVSPGLTEVSRDRVNVRPVAGVPLVHLEHNRWQAAVRRGKRTFDIVGSLTVMMMIAPVLLVVSAWIWLNDRGPVFFSQTRVGRDGEEFRCFKFRSMVVDAEARLAAMKHRDDHVLFKQADDPRITRPGRFIRRFSIDEFPQLWNVLKGDMSLIGPRPPLASEVAAYPPHLIRRLNVRPGMTGLWQVSGRSDLSWEETMRLDLYYVDNWSMLQDLSILLKTVRAVLASRGAY